jgi:glycosyltransferase involved in cell wall biosynthesis
LVFTSYAPFKGLELMLNVYRGLKNELPAVRLTFAGARHTRFPDYVAHLRAEMRGLPDVRCLVDVPESALPALFGRASVVVLPYAATTGASSVFYRAAAWGRAVAASSLPELTAQCAESELKVAFFPPGDATAMRQVLTGLLRDASARATLVEHNLAAAERTGLQATLDAYLRTFDMALEGRKGSALTSPGEQKMPWKG